jgi:hypothetical protein
MDSASYAFAKIRWQSKPGWYVVATEYGASAHRIDAEIAEVHGSVQRPPKRGFSGKKTMMNASITGPVSVPEGYASGLGLAVLSHLPAQPR